MAWVEEETCDAWQICTGRKVSKPFSVRLLPHRSKAFVCNLGGNEGALLNMLGNGGGQLQSVQTTAVTDHVLSLGRLTDHMSFTCSSVANGDSSSA
jgi:hypothetical protein